MKKYTDKLCYLLILIQLLTGCNSLSKNFNDKVNVNNDDTELRIKKDEVLSNKEVNNKNNIHIIENDIEILVEEKEEFDTLINEDNNVNEEYIEENVETVNPISVTGNFGYLNNEVLLDDNLIEKYQKVLIMDEDESNYYVQTDNLLNGYINKEYITILPDLFIEIDISVQSVYLYQDEELILSSLCVSGDSYKHSTRVGYFAITYKTMNTYLNGPGYSSYVNYWMPFDKGIGLHDASWRDEFGGTIYQGNGSHGCINLPYEAAETIYENVSKGTKVLVHK